MNKIFKLMFSALLLVCCATVAHAENNLTVFESNQVSVYVPFPTASYYQGTRGQVIYPAQELTEMVGQTINGFTLYINDEGSKMDGGAVRISMGEVENAVFSSKSFVNGLTSVGVATMTAGAFGYNPAFRSVIFSFFH